MAKTERGSEQAMIRLPDGMRDKLKTAAEQNARSMNAEIVARLESSFETTVDPKALAQAYEFTEDLRARLEKAWEQFNLDIDRFNKDVKDFNARRSEVRHEDMLRRKEREEALEARERRLSDREARFRFQIRERRTAIRDGESRLREEEKRLDEMLERLAKREAELGELIKNLTKNTAGKL